MYDLVIYFKEKENEVTHCDGTEAGRIKTYAEKNNRINRI